MNEKIPLKVALIAYGIIVQVMLDVMLALMMVSSFTSCSTTSKIKSVREANVSAELSLPKETSLPDFTSITSTRDTLVVQDFEGRSVTIMKAVKDENGDMVATDELDAAVVTARFRNVAERHGYVNLEYQIRIPEKMIDNSWQLRFYPRMAIQGDTTAMQHILITGSEYRKYQLRGYEQYNRFLRSIVTDSTKFIAMHQLEVFIERNLPELYAFKTDSTFVSDKEFASRFGVTEQEAIEHYTNKIARSWNNKKISSKGRMYERFVKVPFDTTARLDTVIKAENGDFVYTYLQQVKTRPGLRKIDILLNGEIYQNESRIYTMPGADPLTFYISSLSSFVDDTPHFIKKIVSRRVEANTACYIEFKQGDADVNETIGNNPDEIGRIKRNLSDLIEDRQFDLDSIVIHAYASPEGTVSSNKLLTMKRGNAIRDYFNTYIKNYRDSLNREAGIRISLDDSEPILSTNNGIKLIARYEGENWDMLDNLIRDDEQLSFEDKINYIDACQIMDLDRREMKLRSEGYYKHIRESLYPRLRIVKFDFHLHRKGMVKDTVHTTEIDKVYMEGVQAIKDRDYESAITILRPYKDYNTAVAYCAMDYNASALDILGSLDESAQVDYMMAIICSRLGEEQKAVEKYLRSVQLNPSYEHRGNLDPEISSLLKRYDIESQFINN